VFVVLIGEIKALGDRFKKSISLFLPFLSGTPSSRGLRIDGRQFLKRGKSL